MPKVEEYIGCNLYYKTTAEALLIAPLKIFTFYSPTEGAAIAGADAGTTVGLAG